jgi:hypothetical protein
MAIVDRIVPDIYFGRPGSLETFPWPLGGIQRPYERQVGDFVTGSGGHRVSKIVGGSRRVELTWENLRYDTYARLEAYDRGHMGVGPFALLDPSAINLLTVNQSAATTERNDATGFATSAANHGTPVSNSSATHIHRAGAPRSLRWQFTVAAATNPLLELTTVHSGWFGVPVRAGDSYVFSCWVKPDGTVDASIQVEAKIQWRNAAGGTVGAEATGAVQTVAAWTRLVCIGTAPVGAVYASCRLVAVGSTITTGASLYVDEMQLEVGAAVSDWRPGTGVYPMSVLGLGESVPWASTWRSTPTMILREVVS